MPLGRAFRSAFAPLLWYYAIAVAVPVLNGATIDRPFLEHVAFVIAVPLMLTVLAGSASSLRRALLRPNIAAVDPSRKERHVVHALPVQDCVRVRGRLPARGRGARVAGHLSRH
jgi:hypothetical protein